VFYLVSKLFWLVAEPTTALALLLLLGLLMRMLKRRRTGIGLMAVACVALLLMNFTNIGLLVLQPLEQRFPTPPYPVHVDGIIMLGGGEDSEVSAARHIAELNENADRFVEAARLALRYPRAKLVITGGIGDLTGGGDGDAAIADRFFPQLGIPESRLVLEGKSRNTDENALFTKALIGSTEGETWLLVTSAFHMPRAIGIFRKAGLPVVAWPSDFKTTGEESFGLSLLRPYLNQAAFSIGVREWLGLLAYRLSGKSDDLLPGP
jgi:uncharacterized SAM-binding protein YcdF (DUF218 family)